MPEYICLGIYIQRRKQGLEMSFGVLPLFNGGKVAFYAKNLKSSSMANCSKGWGRTGSFPTKSPRWHHRRACVPQLHKAILKAAGILPVWQQGAVSA